MNIESIRESLSLPLLPGDEPFGLSETERLDPEDWAWLFLRMNGDYIDGFKRALAAANEEKVEVEVNILQELCQGALDNDIILDRDGTCRSRFGLAAWLNPDLKRLPKLYCEGSWFFPLIQPILENYENTEREENEFIAQNRRLNSPIPQFLKIREGVFGYLPPSNRPYFPPDPPSRPSEHSFYDSPAPNINVAWETAYVAVDCSVPLDGQMLALKWLAETNRKHLQGFRYKTHKNPISPEIVNVRKSTAFSHLKFLRSAKGSYDVNASEFWFSFRIDVLGPYGLQLDAHKKLLSLKHSELLDQGLIRSTPPCRLGPLPTMRDGNGGNYLKALVVAYELHRLLNNTKNVVDSLGFERFRYPNGSQSAWRLNFADKIENYIDKASVFVKGDYRWFIHQQRPSENSGA